MSLAIVTLSPEGLAIAGVIHAKTPNSTIFAHKALHAPKAISFSGILQLTTQIFKQFGNIVYIAPCGVVVRAIAPHLENKLKDPAVVVVDIGARWAISLLSGHEGGANLLANEIGNVLFAEPIITTTTEAVKDLIIGMGCRKGALESDLRIAIESAMEAAKSRIQQVRVLASVDIKKRESGLLKVAEYFGVPLRFISSLELRNCPYEFHRSKFVEENVNVPAVAEPCALLAGRRTQLILPRKIINGVTVAIARENSI